MPTSTGPPGPTRRGRGDLRRRAGRRQALGHQRHRGADPRLCLDYVYVEDVARANILALEDDGLSSGAYSIVTAAETNANRLYELMLGISSKNLPPEHGPAKPGEQLRSCVDSTLAGPTFGWRPEVSLSAGLPDILEYFEAAARG